MSEEAREIWERQDGETTKAYRAFSLYRDMPPSRRSIARVAKAINDELVRQGGQRKPYLVRQCQKWSSKYRWVERAHAYDDELDRIARAERAEAIREMARRQASLGRALQVIAGNRLKDIDIRNLSADDIRRYIETGVKVERLALGLSDRSSDVSVTFEPSGDGSYPRVRELVVVPPSDNDDGDGDD